MKRREFIKLSLICSSMVLLPIDMKARSSFKRTLVLVEFDGGNDGLNTVIPFNEENYYKLRPSLAIKKEDTNVVSKDFGLNKNLKNLTKLYKEKDCAIVHGLGYDKPNLSHFRSIEIVETASESNEYLDEGWISKSLERFEINETRPANAVLLGKRKKGHLFSKSIDVLQVKNIEKFIKKSSIIKSSSSLGLNNSSFDFLREQENVIRRANSSFKRYAKSIDVKEMFPQSDIANDFKEAVKLIKSKIDIPVIKISQKGFDTHANQTSRHNELLEHFDSAIGSFVSELKREKLFDDVLIVSYSEFGRRVKENGSDGTDHGTASCQFVIGGRVKGGMYGKAPSLNSLNKNNLIYTTHYRSYYNTILSGWFREKKNSFSSYENLGFL